jgi:hypothetical protein
MGSCHNKEHVKRELRNCITHIDVGKCFARKIVEKGNAEKTKILVQAHRQERGRSVLYKGEVAGLPAK